MQVNPGQLNKKILICRTSSDEKDGDGFNVKRVVIIRNCWASVNNISGTEMIKSGADYSVVKTRFMIRYASIEIKESDYIEYNGKTYNIEYINNFNQSNEYIELLGTTVQL